MRLKIGASCIFVGAKGLRSVERFLTGSVSASVAARAHCSVELVRTWQVSLLKTRSGSN